METIDEIPLGNDFEANPVLDRRNGQTGKGERAAGLSGLTYWLSATDGGAAIHATLSVALTERATAPGDYFAVIDAAAIDAQLTAYVGQIVYGVCTQSGDVKTSKKWRVVAIRRPA